MRLRTRIGGQTYEFDSIKEVLARANEEKSGDRLAGIAARSMQERVAARNVLSHVTLETLRRNPVVPAEEDEVTRVIDAAVREPIYQGIKDWTVGELREYILDDRTTGEDLRRLSVGLTAEMAAAAAKLMSNLDLIYGARKIRVTATCNTTIGVEGTLSARLQPNHPTDSVAGILAVVKEGLSYGVGDAVIGINPVDDSVDSVARILKATHRFLEEWKVPSQNCVLAHISTQMRAVEQGAPADLFFQSLAGTEAGNRSFGIDVALLDRGYELATRYGSAAGPNVMYFETGQGAELSSDSHHGADQVTLEARCYGLARRYHPFLVNTVVGFIGPEYLFNSKQVIRAGLEDHFMGKLLGLPMGVDACYTNHIKADQNDIENLAVLLTAAGANYFMGVPMGVDCMLNYQCTSFHDIATLRQLLGLKPIAAFDAWLEKMEITRHGHLTDRAGDLSIFAAADRQPVPIQGE